ncbi:MAG: hypothetical protein COB17_02020 [Sulfurimonas sp.]|nr:MAG: hypothetical protein COB17_02020 [Sulfurimonas sp.]
MINTRRKFLLAGFAGSVVLLTLNSELFGGVTVLETISVLQEDLFPQTDGVPTKNEINAKAYLGLMLNHKSVRDADKEFIKNGVKWLNEEAIDMYKKTYTKLNTSQRQEVLKSISKTSWGEGFIADILKFIFEAMLGDPIYGINKNESGWIWLNHKPGLPRPTKAYL